MPCERSHLHFFYAFQIWPRRWSSRNIIRTPSGTNTLPEERHCNTIHIGSSGNSSGLAKRFSTIPIPESASMLLRERCRATIPTRSGESLSALTNEAAGPPASPLGRIRYVVGWPHTLNNSQGRVGFLPARHRGLIACRFSQYQPPIQRRQLSA